MGMHETHKKQARSNPEAKATCYPKGCRSFAGMVNFVSMFCPELQKPIYDLTKKGIPYLWGKEQQDAFKEIKSRMQILQFSVCPTEKADLYCIQTPVSLPLAACYTNSKMENPGLLPMQAKECLKRQRTIPSQNWKCVD